MERSRQFLSKPIISVVCTLLALEKLGLEIRRWGCGILRVTLEVLCKPGIICMILTIKVQQQANVMCVLLYVSYLDIAVCIVLPGTAVRRYIR